MTHAACITTSWDDGNPLDLRLADLLNKYGLPGTFYIPRTFKRPTLSQGQIRQLAAGFEIGAHTLDHVELSQADRAAAKEQIIGSKSWLEDIVGRPCAMFCPPCGHYDSQHMRMIRSAGYTGIRSVELLSLSWPRSRDGLWELPTTIQAYPHTAVSYLKNSVRRLAPSNFCRYIRHGTRAPWTSLATSLLHQVQSAGGVFHLWGHSWELDDTQQWRNLEDFFRVLADIVGQVPCLNNSQVCDLALGAKPQHALA